MASTNPLATVVTRLHRYSQERIWRPLASSASPRERLCRRAARFTYIVAHGFRDDQVLLRSSALTFMTLFSLVPFLALGFSIAKGLGLQSRFDEDFFSTLAAGQRDLARWIMSYVEGTNLTALGTIGLVVVLYTVAMMLGSIERSLNEIWGVTESRALHRKFADYVAVLLFAPLLFVASTTLTASLASNTFVQRFLEDEVVSRAWNLVLRVLPVVSIAVALSFLYGFVPNTRVRFRAAVIGGVLAGCIWHLAQRLYIDFQVGVANFNALYGTFASLPIFLVWLRVSWVIVLLGGEIAYAVQHEQTYHPPLARQELSIALRERAALEFLTLVAQRFASGAPPLTASDLAAGIDLPRTTTLEIVDALVRSGLLARSAEPDDALLPARDLSRMGVGDVLLRFRHQGVGTLGDVAHGALDERIAEIHRGLEDALRAAGAAEVGPALLAAEPVSA
ncbi:MAG: YhjD/YihY/BrkB family envelope integrity protein [bacterium]